VAKNRVQILLEVDDKGTAKIRQFAGDTKKELDTLQRKSSTIAEKLKTSWKLVGSVIGTVSAAAFAKLTVDSIKAADAIGKTADKLGLSTQALQQYRFAANQSGVETKTLEMALQRFTRRVAEAAQGKGELKDTLIQYNIAVKDSEGKTRKTEEVLRDLANTIQSTKDPAERLRLAFKSFDSEGAVMVNMLKDGSAGLDEMRDRAVDLGLVMDDKLIRAAESANDKLDQLRKLVDTKVKTAFVSLSPAIEGAVMWLQRFLDLGDKSARLDEVHDQINKLSEELRHLQEPGFFQKFGQRVNEAFGHSTQDQIKALEDRLKALREERNKLVEDLREPPPKILPPPRDLDIEKEVDAARKKRLAEEEREKERAAARDLAITNAAEEAKRKEYNKTSLLSFRNAQERLEVESHFYEESTEQTETFWDEYKSGLKGMSANYTDTVQDMANTFIQAEDTKQAMADFTARFVASRAGMMATWAYEQAIEKTIALIGAYLGEGSAKVGAQGANKGGVWGAIGEIGIYLSTGVAAMLAGRTLARKFAHASGGWMEQNPDGGWIRQGSGMSDDVFLGATPGVRHWGMGGEFVIRKEAARKWGPLLEALNRNYDDGGYVNYQGTKIPWTGTADALALGTLMSFAHGLPKGLVGAVAETIVYWATAVPSMFLGKLLSEQFYSSGGWMDVGYGWGLPSPKKLFKGGKELVDRYLMPRGVRYLEDPMEFYKDYISPAARAPLEGISRDLVTPHKYWSNPISHVQIGLKNAYDVAKDFWQLSLPTFQEGGVATQTMPAIVHKDERIFSAMDNKELIRAIQGKPQKIELHLHNNGVITTNDVHAWLAEVGYEMERRTMGRPLQGRRIEQAGLRL